MDQTNQKLEQFKKALNLIGFSEEESQKQILELENIISISILARVVQEKKVTNLTLDNLKSFLAENYKPEELKEMVEEESERTIKDYLKTITSSLSKDKQKEFYSQLQ